MKNTISKLGRSLNLRAALYGPKPEYTELDLDDKDCVIGNYRLVQIMDLVQITLRQSKIRLLHIIFGGHPWVKSELMKKSPV